MSKNKRRKKRKYQKRRKSNEGYSTPKVSEAVNKRDEKNFFRIAIITTVVLMIILFFIYQSIV